MKREVVISVGVALVVTLLLAALVVIGSRRLSHFDAALVGYTFATLFAAFGIAYRYAMWLQRPPTSLYWKRGWQLASTPGHFRRNAGVLITRFVRSILLNDFIWRRGFSRGAAHWMIFWGCLLAAAITFPLVFGWLHFESVPDDLASYRLVVFGFPTIAFRTDSILGGFIFHGLVWAALLVIPGVMLAMQRRMRDRDAAALQEFGEDFLPLILLFSVSVTGLMLTASYQWMYGYAFEFLAIVHAVTVIVTLLYLPFGKLFHIFQRPAQLGVALYKEAGRTGPQAKCARCGDEYASQMHVDDLIEVERRLGYDYSIPGRPEGHYQRICPRCRRLLPALVLRGTWSRSTTGRNEPAASDRFS